jgi:hypothetical protein
MPVSGCPFSRAGVTDPGYSSSVSDFDLDKPPRFFRNFRPMKTTIRLFFALLALFSLFAAGREAQAVVPPPDGGYPNFNTAEGQKALFSLTTGAANTAVGWFSLQSLTTGSFNTATGAGALLLNTADNNTAFGAAALLSNTMGLNNTATGVSALANNTIGTSNTATGFNALFTNAIGNANTAFGDRALVQNTTGTNNTANGQGALGFNTTGTANTALGAQAGSNVTTANAVIAIGIAGENVSNSCYIGQIFGVTSSGGTAVFINSAGKLGTATSSRRFKEEIKPMDKASEALLALKPVTFHYKKDIDPQGIAQFGLVAEDVEAVNPDLVVRDNEGKVNSVRYDAVNAMLLNEFLKEHRKVQEQDRELHEQAATIAQLKSTVAQQQKGMEAVVAHIKEQAAQIQKVSAQLESSRPAPRVVNNP